MSRLEELIALAQKGDKGASEDLITENSGLIWSVARRYLGRGVEGDDLYQLGCLGFLKAVEGFDPEYGARPLRRILQQTVEDKLSEEILEGKLSLGDAVQMDVEDNVIVFKKV